MFVMAVLRAIMLEQWALQSLFLLVLPVSSAFFVGALYLSNLRARADVKKLDPWRKWGAFLSTGCCGGLLLIQVVPILGRLDILPSYLPAIGRTLAVMMPIMCLLAFNQAPKLPHFERRSIVGWDLGPIYGPRYVRAVSRVLAVFMIAAIAHQLTLTAGRSTPFPFSLAAAFVVAWSIAWRLHLVRKWKRRQSLSAG
jgi:hypothetical protein